MANVFTEGFLGMGITLAARLQSSGAYFLTNQDFVFYPLREFVHYASATTELIREYFPVPRPDDPFPYGVAVEPP